MIGVLGFWGFGVLASQGIIFIMHSKLINEKELLKISDSYLEKQKRLIRKI
jgi:hypothetical protein